MKLLSYVALLTLLACNNPATFSAGSKMSGSSEDQDGFGEDIKGPGPGSDKTDSDTSPDGTKKPREDDPNTPEDESKLDENGNPLSPNDPRHPDHPDHPNNNPNGPGNGNQPGKNPGESNDKPGGSSNTPTPEECRKNPSLCGDYDQVNNPPTNSGGGNQNQNQNGGSRPNQNR